ncbi:MAG: hypothetical protein U0838_11705 [Chloroflexota bacterium]
MRAAIGLAKLGDPADPAAFRWTFEGGAARGRVPARGLGELIEDLRTLIAAGRLSISGGYLNNAVLAGDEELARGARPWTGSAGTGCRSASSSTPTSTGCRGAPCLRWPGRDSTSLSWR